MSGQAFMERISRRLQEANIPFKIDAAIGGILVDFLISAPDGRRIIVETKSYAVLTSNSLTYARDQKRAQLKATKVDRIFYVIEGLKRDLSSDGIFTEARLVKALLRELNVKVKVRKSLDLFLRREEVLPQAPSPPRTVFAAMPFSSDYEDVYYLAMAPAAQSVNAVCQRVDQTTIVGDVVREIRRLIDESIAIIADLSESNPNVLYEVGLAHAIGRKTVQICSTPLEQLPFDVRNISTLKYRKGQVHKLSTDLTTRLKALLAGN